MRGLALALLVGHGTAIPYTADSPTALTATPEEAQPADPAEPTEPAETPYLCPEPVANPSPLDFDAFCSTEFGSDEFGCWPSAWLFGAQKAATTSVVDLLEWCGTSTVAYTTEANMLFCPANTPCKETHALLEPDVICEESNITLACDLAQNITSSFTGLFRKDLVRTHSYGQIGRLYAPDASRTAAYTEGRFLEGTPSIGLTTAPSTLFHMMPASLRPLTRFAVILREPTERMLSYFNHLLLTGGVPENTTFAAYTHDLLTGTPDTNGNYADFIEAYLEAGWNRSQLLVLGFEELVTETARSIRKLTTHYGTPVLVNASELPVENAHNGNNKVVSIACETRDLIETHYASMNERLYALLNEHHDSGLAPPMESHFKPFEMKLACSEIEETTADLEALQAAEEEATQKAEEEAAQKAQQEAEEEAAREAALEAEEEAAQARQEAKQAAAAAEHAAKQAQQQTAKQAHEQMVKDREAQQRRWQWL